MTYKQIHHLDKSIEEQPESLQKEILMGESGHDDCADAGKR